MTLRFRAPGRVNLMGDHTDYNEGFVLPSAIQLDCVVEAEARADGRVCARSAGRKRELDVAADGTDDPAAVRPYWGRYVAGVVRALAARGRPSVGADLSFESSVPAGAGLSSSAALEVAAALPLCALADFELEPAALALACREAEQLATGVPAGVMDQLVSIAGEDGTALAIDCRDLTFDVVAVPSEVGFVVAHSGRERMLEDTDYAARRRGCEELAAKLGLDTLRDATAEQVAEEPLGRHVVSENLRVRETADALRRGDVRRVGDLFRESHASLRHDFRVSTVELDDLVAALEGAGAAGARLTGAGFGGCVVAVCERERAGELVGAAGDRWSLVVEPSPGAGPL